MIQAALLGSRDETVLIHGKIEDIEEDVRFMADSLETLHDSFQQAVDAFLARKRSGGARGKLWHEWP